MERNQNKGRNQLFGTTATIGLLIYLATVQTQCTKAPIHHRPDDGSTNGNVVIRPTQEAITLPPMTYYLYNLGGNGGHLSHNCDGSGNYSGALPTSQWTALAVNAATGNVELRYMDSFNTATACVIPTSEQTISRAGDVFYPQPGMFYSVRTGNFNVIDGADHEFTPDPVAHTRLIYIRFIPGGELSGSITGITGILRGVLTHIDLATGTAHSGAVTRAASNAMTFGCTADNDGFLGQLALFGIANPDRGNNYTNTLTATITTSDGNTTHTDIDLTATLTDIINSHQGVIPLELPLQINLSSTEIGILAEVEAWEDVGDSTPEL